MQDNGRKILDIQVMRRGFSMKDNKPLTTYSVKNEELIKTIIPQTGIKRVSVFTKGSFVKFGNHPVAESIKQLGISKKPFMSVYYTERSGILPSGTVVEKNEKAPEGAYILPRLSNLKSIMNMTITNVMCLINNTQL